MFAKAAAFVNTYKTFFTCSGVFGVSIGVANVINTPKSPDYQRDTFHITRCLGMSAAKGCIYSFFFPIPFISMGLQLIQGNERAFKDHLIPFSRYNSKHPTKYGDVNAKPVKVHVTLGS